MKYKIPLLFVMFILISVAVTSVGESGKPYIFFNVEKCYGDINVRVYPLDMDNYTLLGNCITPTGDKNHWICPCQQNLTILTPELTSSKFSALVQYNIDKPREVNTTIGGMPTEDDLYNDEIKRIYTIRDIIIVPNGNDISGALSLNPLVNKILLTAVIVFGILMFVGFVYIVIFWFYSEEMRKWLGIGEDDKMSLGMIIKRIFTREDISRKTLIRKEGKVLPIIKSVEPIIEKKNESKVSNVQDEARRILEDLDK
jgi:hypothetical protein